MDADLRSNQNASFPLNSPDVDNSTSLVPAGISIEHELDETISGVANKTFTHGLDENPTPLETRVTVDDPVHAVSTEVKKTVGDFKTDIEDAQKTNKAKIKNATNVKIKKVAYIALGILGAVLATVGVGAICAFCPPIGAVILAVGSTVIASGGISAAIFMWPDEVPEQQVEEMKIAGENVDRALKFFEEHPKTEESEGNSFEEFLEEECPITYDEKLKAPSYKLEDLGKYNRLFEKKLAIQNNEKNQSALTDKNNELHDQLNQLRWKLNISGTTEEEEKAACSAKISKLEKDNEILQQETPNSITIQSNKDKIKELKGFLKTLDLFEKNTSELEKLTAELPSLRDTYQTDKAALEREIKKASVPPYAGPDTRNQDPRLTDWLASTIQTPETIITINDDGESIYTFGTLAEKPTHGIHGTYNNKTYSGEYLHLGTGAKVTDTYKALGHTVENNFLSNAYEKTELKIGEKSYKSVTHYMLSKKCDLLIASSDPDQKIRWTSLQENIEKASTVERALQLTEQMWLPNDLFAGEELDQELKRALFYKFVGADGTLTTEGEKLVATGNKALYAGHERGDPSYGVQFIDKNQMIGQNKLGIYLMDLRSRIKESGPKMEIETIEPLANEQKEQVVNAALTELLTYADEKIPGFREALGQYWGRSSTENEILDSFLGKDPQEPSKILKIIEKGLVATGEAAWKDKKGGPIKFFSDFDKTLYNLYDKTMKAYNESIK